MGSLAYARTSGDVAETLAENHRMLNLLRRSEYPVSLRLSSGVVLAELPTQPAPGTGLVPAA